MAHSITGWIQANPIEVKAGDFRKFTFKIGIKFYDHDQQKNLWANYTINVFAKDLKADYYRNNLVEGSIAEVSCMQLAPRIGYNAAGTAYAYIEMMKATVGDIWNIDQINKWRKEKLEQNKTEENN